MNELAGHYSYSRLIRYCLPPIGMMIFTSIYGVVDGFFVSNFAGKIPFAAVNLIMPALMILGGIGFMFGTGGTALVARTLGEDKPELASRYFSMVIWLSGFIGLLAGILGMIFAPQMALALGASEEMLPYCVQYARVCLFFNAAFILQNTFQPFMSAAGKPGLGFLFTICAGLTNIVLDWLFIAVFGWGAPGAAIATGIGQCVGGLVPMIWFWKTRDSLLHLSLVMPKARPMLKAAFNGCSELMSNVSSSIVSILFNFQLMRYAGENGVAAYGVLMYVGFIFVAIFVGYTIGVAPVISYNYGAGDRAEMHSLFKKSIFLNLASGVAMFALAEVLAGPLAHLYTGYDAGLMEITVGAMHIFSTCIILAGLNIFTSALFTALNNGLISAVVAFLRSLVFQSVCVLVLPVFFGINGIWWSMTVAELLAFGVNLIILVKEQKRYGY